MPGHEAAVVLARPAQPFAEIGADRSDTVLPDTVNGRGEVVPITAGDFGNDLIEPLPRPIEVAWPHREQAFRR